MARFTLFDLRHFVQTLALLTVPFSSAILTVWILAFHFLFVCLLEWDTAFPDTCPLPQISHFLDIYRTSSWYFKLIKHMILLLLKLERMLLYHTELIDSSIFYLNQTYF